MAANAGGLPAARGHAGLAILAADAGDFAKAEAESKASLDILDIASTRTNYGMILLRQGRADEGKAELEKALDRDPFDLAALKALADAYRTDDAEKARGYDDRVRAALTRIQRPALGLCSKAKT
jgi:Tfp pilus assembly protein PilF